MYIKDLLAICPFCNLTSADLAYYLRCKAELPDDVNVKETLITWNDQVTIQKRSAGER